MRPWLYRIARNRSLNHLRRVQPIGVDSMDIHMSEAGLTTADKVHKREDFRLLVADVQDLPETQKTALLLREIDALSYEQIAEAMETTIPSVKSLLVRARVSLAECAEARTLTCEQVREELGEVAEGLRRSTAPVRRHVRGCDRCQGFKAQLRSTNKALAAVFPVAPLLLFKKALLTQFGMTASAGAGGAAGAAAATVAATGGTSAMSAGHQHDRDEDRRHARRRGDRHRRRRRGQARADEGRRRPPSPPRRRSPAPGRARRARGRRRGRSSRRTPARASRRRARRGAAAAEAAAAAADRRRGRRRHGRRPSRPPTRAADRAAPPAAPRSTGRDADRAGAGRHRDDDAQPRRRPARADRRRRGAVGAGHAADRHVPTPPVAAARPSPSPPPRRDSSPTRTRPPAAPGTGGIEAAPVAASAAQAIRSPGCEPASGSSSRTGWSSATAPSTSTSERTGPIWRGGKFTTRDDEPALELLTRVVRDLRRGALLADLRAEVDAQLPGRLARLGEVLDRDDPADAHVDLLEVLPLDHDVPPLRSSPKRNERSGVFSAPWLPISSAFGVPAAGVDSISRIDAVAQALGLLLDEQVVAPVQPPRAAARAERHRVADRVVDARAALADELEAAVAPGQRAHVARRRRRAASRRPRRGRAAACRSRIA